MPASLREAAVRLVEIQYASVITATRCFLIGGPWAAEAAGAVFRTPVIWWQDGARPGTDAVTALGRG